MTNSELMAFRSANLFVRRVLREIPVSEYEKTSISEELCGHILEKLEDGASTDAPDENTVNAAVTDMGKPKEIGKLYRGGERVTMIKGSKIYKHATLRMFLLNWLALPCWFVLMFLTVSGGMVTYNKVFLYIIPAVAVAFFCGQTLPKWHNVLLTIFPWFPIIPIALIFLLLSGDNVGGIFMVGGLMVQISLAWSLPAAIVFVYFAIEDYMNMNLRKYLHLGLLAVTVFMAVFGLSKASFYQGLAEADYITVFNTLDTTFEQYIGGEEDIGPLLLDAIEAFETHAKHEIYKGINNQTSMTNLTQTFREVYFEENSAEQTAARLKQQHADIEVENFEERALEYGQKKTELSRKIASVLLSYLQKYVGSDESVTKFVLTGNPESKKSG